MQNGQGKAQGAHRAPPSISAETYRQDACGRCPRSARQPPAAGKCAGLCAAGRLLGKPAPALSRGGRLLAEAPHAMRGWAVAPHLMRGKGGRNIFPVGATPHAPLRPKPSRSNNGSTVSSGQGKAQGAHSAPPSISAGTYRQDVCGRCPRSARQPPAAGKCAGLCAAGRLLGKPAPALSRGWRLLAEAPHAMRVGP